LRLIKELLLLKALKVLKSKSSAYLTEAIPQWLHPHI